MCAHLKILEDYDTRGCTGTVHTGRHYRLSLIHEDGGKQVAASNNESDEEDDDIGMMKKTRKRGTRMMRTRRFL